MKTVRRCVGVAQIDNNKYYFDENGVLKPAGVKICQETNFIQMKQEY